MRLSEHKAAFDPSARVKDAKALMIILSPEQWANIEHMLGRHVAREELQELLLGLFSGKYKLVKR
jgi:hypothetical protein